MNSMSEHNQDENCMHGQVGERATLLTRFAQYGSLSFFFHNFIVPLAKCLVNFSSVSAICDKIISAASENYNSPIKTYES